MSDDQRGRHRVVAAFSGASTYDDHARVQRVSAGWLADKAMALSLPDEPRICDIGCGTGLLSEALGRRIPAASFLSTDISAEMLARARRRLMHDSRYRFAIADGEAPTALAAETPFDLVCSNLAAQWFSDLGGAVRALLGLLRPGGRLLITTLSADTFQEWREAHAAVGLQPGTPNYPSRTELAALAPPGVRCEIEIRHHVEEFESGQAFLSGLRAIGAHTPQDGHRPLNAGQMRRVLREFARKPQVTYQVAICSFDALRGGAT